MKVYKVFTTGEKEIGRVLARNYIDALKLAQETFSQYKQIAVRLFDERD